MGTTLDLFFVQYESATRATTNANLLLMTVDAVPDYYSGSLSIKAFQTSKGSSDNEIFDQGSSKSALRIFSS